MFTAIITVEAVAATGAAMYAISQWVKFRRSASDASARAIKLHAECERLSSFITTLSNRLEVQRSKPGPQKRARERAMIAAKTAELVREIAA